MKLPNKDIRSPWQKEWDKLQSKESAYLKKHSQKKDSILTTKLEDKIPDKLQSTLNIAFTKAFDLIFQKGTKVIEKTYNKDQLEHNFKVNEFAASLREDKRTLRKFSKNASNSSTKNLVISGVEGVGLGVLGIGIPDIPVFVGVLLKSIYEVALHYGYPYDTPEEQYFILKLIETSCLHGEQLLEANREVDLYIETRMLPDTYSRETQIQQASCAMSTEMIYTKFIQGIPIVGAVGGAFDAIYTQKVLSYAKIKYNRRFLKERRK